MNFSRRSFIAGIVATAVVPTFVGCTTNQQDVAALVGTLSTAVASLAELQGASALATRLRVDGEAASVAVANWKNGSSPQLAVEAINLVEADLSLIPIDPKYSDLITLALATASFLVSLIPQSVAKVAGLRPFLGLDSETPDKRKKDKAAKQAAKSDKEFRKKWNALIAKHPELQSAALPDKPTTK